MTATTSYSVIMRVRLPKKAHSLDKLLAELRNHGAGIGAIDLVRSSDNGVIRDITIEAIDETHAAKLQKIVNALEDTSIEYMSDRTFLLHLGGKLSVSGKVPIVNRDDLSMAYTPGVARVCMAIHNDPIQAFHLTVRHNTVAIVSDGSAVLGLGNIGPLAALPVMEGKAMLLKAFADVDGFPICLATQDDEEIIRTVVNIAPNFGAINLEDIAAPRCFTIEARLKELLDIPVFHDDQHGTAAVLTAALINALKVTGKKMNEIKVVFNGVGAAGTACTKMLLQLGIHQIIGCDRQGAITTTRTDLNFAKRQYAEITNPKHEEGSLQDVMQGADVFVGLSSGNILTVDDLKRMNPEPIVFAMANPTPEIMPEIASPYVAVMATGRSDYPNQINNLLAFPGIFRGALDCRASDINTEMNIAAAYAIANVIDDQSLTADYIVPSVFNPEVAKRVAEAVKQAAYKTKVARKIDFLYSKQP